MGCLRLIKISDHSILITEFFAWYLVVFIRKMQNSPSFNQLLKYKECHPKSDIITSSFGVPIVDQRTSLTVGERGPIVLQDHVLLNELASFGRERIPERVVHAKGAGAFGYFECTNDITECCMADLFSCVGKKCDIAVRFSTVAGERGSADTVRDARGFAIKFYTDKGIWDLVGQSFPIFFIRDPMRFPSFVHSNKNNPATNLPDPIAHWDFISLCPETTHLVMLVQGDRGIPDGYRHMNGYGCHTFKLVNASGKAVYCKFHLKPKQNKWLTSEKAKALLGEDPNYSTRDLYDAIENKDYPTWDFYIQVMTFKQAEDSKFNPFDVTKIWSHKEHPLIPVGKLVLNRNPKNYFEEVEQIAFCPGNLPIGIEASPDKMLLGRIFSYSDTSRYRLGRNHLQLPVNAPKNRVINYQRDGSMAYNNQGNAPFYYPNSFNGPVEDTTIKQSTYSLSGDVDRHEDQDDDNFSQATLFWNMLKKDAKQRLVLNIANGIKRVPRFIQERVLVNFCQVSPDMSDQIIDALKSFEEKEEQKCK